MTETAEEPPSQNLARLLAPALEAVDKGFALCELPLPGHPFQAALDLIRYEFLAVRAGEPIDFDGPAHGGGVGAEASHLPGDGAHPHKHELVADLLSHAGANAVAFDRSRQAAWPNFNTISNRRYGKDYVAGFGEFYAAYKLILDLVAACVRTIAPPLASGSGLLLHGAPYLIDHPILPR